MYGYGIKSGASVSLRSSERGLKFMELNYNNYRKVSLRSSERGLKYVKHFVTCD